MVFTQINGFGDLTNLGAYGFIMAIGALVLFWLVRSFFKLLREEREENSTLHGQMLRMSMDTHSKHTEVLADLAKTVKAIHTDRHTEVLEHVSNHAADIKAHVTAQVAGAQKGGGDG